MNYLESAKSLAQSTKRPLPVKEAEPDRHGEDQELEQLEQKWRGLLEDGKAILRMEVCRRHAVRLQDFSSWFVTHVENVDDYKHGRDFFSFPDGDLALLVTVDDAIAADNIETILGRSGERYEGTRDRERLGQQQTHAETGDDFLDEMYREW